MEGVEVGAPRDGFGYTGSPEKMDNTLEQEGEEAAQKVVGEVDMKNPQEEEAEVDTDFWWQEVEERNQDADNLNPGVPESNSAEYTKIHHSPHNPPNSASTDFPWIETAVAEGSDSAEAVAEEQNSTAMMEEMAYTKPWDTQQQLLQMQTKTLEPQNKLYNSQILFLTTSDLPIARTHKKKIKSKEP